MSDSTNTPPPTPADVAPKPRPAEPAPAEPSPVESPAQDDPVDWKAEARKWEARAKENKAAAENASKTEAEKVADRLAAVEKRALEAEARVLRREVALEHKLPKDDAALLDTITDEGAMRALAARLAAAAGSDSKHNYVPREGDNPRPGRSTSSWGPVLAQLDQQRAGA